MSLAVVGGEIGGRRCDLRAAGGTIVDLGPSLRPAPGDEVVDATGRVVLPGLWDHHLHLRALAAAGASVVVGPPDVTDGAGFATALRRAALGRAAPGRAALGGAAPTPAVTPAGEARWVRAVGYHESVAGDLDRRSLDALVPGVPIRVQHRSGALWVVSSAGAAALGLAEADHPGIERDAAGYPTGRLFRMDAWLSERLPRAPIDLGEVSHRLARWGVTGLTDATPGATADGLADLVAQAEAGRIVQRLHLMCPPDVAVPAHPRVTRGPHKVLLDDDRLPSLDELVGLVEASHDAGSAVAVHCVTRVQLVMALEALRAAGPRAGDRVEHASLVAAELVPALVELGVTVVTNPSFVRERGDAYRADVPAVDQPDLYRCASLRAAGVKVAAGTDAPFASADPWVAMEAATTRRTRSGHVLGGDEAVPTGAALGLFTGRPDDPSARRRLLPGEPADLCVVERPGPGVPCRGDVRVVATVVGATVVHRRA